MKKVALPPQANKNNAPMLKTMDKNIDKVDKNSVMAMMNYKVDENLNVVKNSYSLGDNLSLGMKRISDSSNYSCWDYWHRDYYPTIIHDSYPVYIRERAEDKGKQAFEIIKMLKDKRFIKLETVADFIDAMDALIKIL